MVVRQDGCGTGVDRLRGGLVSDRGGVDLAEVVCGGGEVEFASGSGEASSGKSVQDGLEGSDAGLDGRAASLVYRGALGGSESVSHGLACSRVGGRLSDGGRLPCGCGLFPALAQCDEPIWSGASRLVLLQYPASASTIPTWCSGEPVVSCSMETASTAAVIIGTNGLISFGFRFTSTAVMM